jgi:PleD family two-component response regulator
MKGSINVKSELGKGTEFIIRIHFSRTEYSEQEEETKEIKPFPSGNKYSVLLAEDNVINQKITMINLQQLGHDVELAVNGTQAWEMYREKD